MKRTTSKRPRRRGMTVILILGLLTITIALSYAMLRTQATSQQIQTNLNRRNDARQAAHTGLTVALRRMHEPNWAGVNVPVLGYYQDGNRYVVYYVVFETGDANLSPTDPDYDKFPYRVTLKSTGWVVTPPHSGINSMHTATAVVELVPRALSSQPANWASLQNHTVHQWANRPLTCQTPIRIEGPAALQGPISLCADYPPVSRPWHGTIDEVAVFNKALSAAEIQSVVDAAALGDGSMPSVYASLGPQNWWRLNEAAGAVTAADSSGAATGSYENGTVAGQTGVPIGIANGAARFDGRNDHINVGNVDLAGGVLTLLAWFKADSWKGSDDARIISKATGTSVGDHYWLLGTTTSGSNRRLRFRVRTSGSTTTLVASSGNLQAGQWYCAAAVYNGSTMKLYLNGVEVGSSSKSGTLNTNAAVPVYIGDNPPGSPQTRYLRDLEAMRAAGGSDWRPFDGPLDMPLAGTDDSTLAMLQDDLNITTNDVAVSNSAPLSHPGAVTSYQLYPGGKTYTISVLGAGQRTEDISPDVDTNPLGVCRVNGQIDLADGVNVNGTIITVGSDPDIDIDGDNVHLAAVPLPPLYGTSTPIELPAAIVSDDVHVGHGVGNQITGLIFAGDDFTFQSGTQGAACDLQGRLLSAELKMHGRTEWSSVTQGEWESRLTAFVNQLSGSSPELYFPNWLNSQHSLSSEPLLTIRPRSDAVSYHWPDFSQPIFVPHAGDAGLLWQIVSWSDGQ